MELASPRAFGSHRNGLVMSSTRKQVTSPCRRQSRRTLSTGAGMGRLGIPPEGAHRQFDATCVTRT
jgi:hypothetical protein